MRQKEVLLIIPAYNEEKNIEKVMKQLAQPEIADIVDVLVMNDLTIPTGWRRNMAVRWLLMFLIWDMAVGCSLDINMQSEGAILMLFRWMRMGSTMCAISRKFTRD